VQHEARRVSGAGKPSQWRFAVGKINSSSKLTCKLKLQMQLKLESKPFPRSTHLGVSHSVTTPGLFCAGKPTE
jgi:hypothetical protein